MMREDQPNGNSFPLMEIPYKRGSSDVSSFRSDFSLRTTTTLNTMGLHSQKEEFPLKHCEHEMAFQRSMKNDASRRAERTLIFVSLLTVLFIVAELIGGYLAHSLAIMTDAFHMISDLGSFLISIMAIHLARRNPTARYSFGFQRAEVLGALTSIIIIWILTGVLVYMAVIRIVNNDIEVDANTMMITAGIGVVFNLIMGAALHFGKTGHSHFGMSHSHGTHSHGHSHDSHAHSHNHDEESQKHISDVGQLAVPIPTTHHAHTHEPQTNLNLRAAFIHVLGDLVQSIGVLIAAVVIKFTGFSLADPICTFLFGVLVLGTTLSVLRDTIHILMEATPSHISLSKVCSDLMSIDGVSGVHSLRIWSLKMDSTAISVHLDTVPGADINNVVRKSQEKLQHEHGIDFITVQAWQCSLSPATSELQLLAVNP
ncbi:Zinc transporter 2 [Aphelenchoides besseyi]|nr:Zinc transporter 2 [Aphelenchoides besseyi]